MTSSGWSKDFAPSYTPLEMLDLGIFEGVYTAAIPNIPKEYKKHKNVLPRGSEPDVTINHYGVKSRLSLKEWKKRKWTTRDSPLGWWQWYCMYWLGRRLGDEDEWQIARWRSFVARHMGQVASACDLNDPDCHRRQRQGLLQWAWDSTKPFTEEQQKKNLTRLQRTSGIVVSQESVNIIPNRSFTW